VDIVHIIISLLVGVAAGFVAAVTAGAGLLSIPALIFLGLPANEAIATNALAIFGMLASALPKYQKAKQIRWDTARKLIPLAILGGFIGAKALVRIDVNALSVAVGVLLLLMVPVVLLNSDKGLKTFQAGDKRVVLGYLVYLLTMVYGGFLGAGAGVFAMYTLVFFFGMTYMQAKATISVPSVFLAATAFMVFVGHGLVNWKLGVPMTIGMYIGGAWGAKTALEKGNAWVRIIFVVVVVASSVKLLFFR
jgi:uncharacterized membrane protein YfcA